MTTSPDAFPRRTPLAPLLKEKGARWRTLPGIAVAEALAGEPDPRTLAIADLSPFPRLGFKGRGTIPAMQARGIVCEAKANQAYEQPDGSLCLVLAPSEVILLSNAAGDGTRLADLEAAWTLDAAERTYPIPRNDSHAWFRITGHAAPAMFAKICAIDMRREKFPPLGITQTSVAKMTAIVTRQDIGSVPAFHVLADARAALYFCSCLTDAALEFGGAMIGLRAIEELRAHEAARGHQEA